jgi:hypothetical protein
MEIVWALAARCPRSVFDANFQFRSPNERARIPALQCQKVKIYRRFLFVEVARNFCVAPPLYSLSRPSDETLPPKSLLECDRPIRSKPLLTPRRAPAAVESLEEKGKKAWLTCCYCQ